MLLENRRITGHELKPVPYGSPSMLSASLPICRMRDEQQGRNLLNCMGMDVTIPVCFMMAFNSIRTVCWHLNLS